MASHPPLEHLQLLDSQSSGNTSSCENSSSESTPFFQGGVSRRCCLAVLGVAVAVTLLALVLAGSLGNDADKIHIRDVEGGGSSMVLLHFLFLAIDDVPHAEIWKAFFANAPKGSFKIWLHCKDRSSCMNSKFLRLLPQTNLVATVPAAYCVDLVTPEIQLLTQALASGPGKGSMEKFLLLSDSTLPLKPFSYVLRELSKSVKSDFCIYPLCPSNECTVEHFGQHNFWAKGVATSTRKVASLPMSSQFFVLNRQNATTLASRWGRPESRPLGTLTVQRWNETNRHPYVYTATQPVWNISIIGKANDDERKSLANFTGWDSCIDEEVVFSMIFGAVVFDENKITDVPGFGKLFSDEKHMTMPQGVCRSYFSFQMRNPIELRSWAALGGLSSEPGTRCPFPLMPSDCH
eukprot:TRINITY_DN11709_c0_g1_i2.p1 TRINITY_DN11709_c0_g1~~TRINITY_DN11709_c0_g1_i2.p1  ORF type:complete len:406 (+),score=38.47 TRINITY_DN11709_c0_g1_i2:38-1255(+)